MCDTCDLGRWGNINGCKDCEIGQYNDARGQKSCISCPIDTFGTQSKSTSNLECVKCESTRTTGLIKGATDVGACLCKRVDYYQNDHRECIACPVGADCSAKNGITLSELVALNGYWRPDRSTTVFSNCKAGYNSLEAQQLADDRCCPLDPNTNLSICVQTGNASNGSFTHTDEQCQNGYSGALCLVCANGFVKQGTTCISCPGGASIGIAVVPLLVMLTLLFVVVLAFILGGRKATTNAETSNKWFGQAKIILTFVQILSSMPGVLDGVPWPKPFLEFTLPLSLSNLDFLSVLQKTGCGLNVRFYDRFLLHMILPFGCFFVILLAFIVATKKCLKEDDVKHMQAKEIASKATILVILLLYPGLST